MTMETVNVPRYLTVVTAKFTVRVDLARFADDTARGIGIATAIGNLVNDAVGASSFTANAPDTVKKAEERVAAWYANPEGGSRVSDTFRDVMRTAVIARKIAKRAEVAKWDAEACAAVLPADAVEMAGTIAGAPRDRIAAMVELSR